MLCACAQSGCQACTERLFRQHAGLVHWVIRRNCWSDLPYGVLVHEGQIESQCFTDGALGLTVLFCAARRQAAGGAKLHNPARDAWTPCA